MFELSGSAGELEFVRHISEDSRFFEDYLRVPKEKDLVCRAVSLFQEKTGFDKGLKITLTKCIPTGAGLGGGSSDAASTLIALDHLAGTGLQQSELLEMAQALGSDVPFFIDYCANGGAAWVKGRGELLEQIEIPPGLCVLLVKPNFSVTTAKAFAELDRSREKGEGSFPSANRLEGIDSAKLCEILLKTPHRWPFSNDFLPILPHVLPEAGLCEEICAKLKKDGAAFAGLSGSGSCCFGIFKKKPDAEKISKKPHYNEYFTKLTFFLAKRPELVLE